MGVLFHRYLNTSPRELRKRYRELCGLPKKFAENEEYNSP